jgi:hypothetical protein
MMDGACSTDGKIRNTHTSLKKSEVETNGNVSKGWEDSFNVNFKERWCEAVNWHRIRSNVRLLWIC